MFLDFLQRLGIVDEREDVPHRTCQANDMFVAIFLVYEHLNKLPSIISDSTNCEGQTDFVRG